MVIVFINEQTVCLLWNAKQSEKQNAFVRCLVLGYLSQHKQLLHTLEHMVTES